MTIASAHDSTALVFQLAAALEGYQVACERLAKRWRDPKGLHAVNRRLGEIQAFTASIPQLAVDTMNVVIRHIEFMRCLLTNARSGKAATIPTDLVALQSRLGAAINAMRSKCLRLLSGKG